MRLENKIFDVPREVKLLIFTQIESDKDSYALKIDGQIKEELHRIISSIPSKDFAPDIEFYHAL